MPARVEPREVVLETVGAPAVGRPALWAWITSLSCAGSYMLTYFWRYPVFMLPPAILHQPVLPSLDLQACLSLAFIIGFGAAKLPAAAIASSAFFFRNRLRVLLLLMTLSALIEGLGLMVQTPAVMILAVFVSAFFSSWLWGMMLTYLEGRRATERHVAVATLCLIYAGNAARGTASAVLDAGVPPAWMPALVSGCAWLPACALLVLLDRSPKPSAADEAARCRRSPMDGAARRRFLMTWAGGLGTLILAYALLVGLRRCARVCASRACAHLP